MYVNNWIVFNYLLGIRILLRMFWGILFCFIDYKLKSIFIFATRFFIKHQLRAMSLYIYNVLIVPTPILLLLLCIVYRCVIRWCYVVSTVQPTVNRHGLVPLNTNIHTTTILCV